MENSLPLEQQLLGFLQTKDFGQLRSFKDSATWSTLTDGAREILGMLFIAQGEHQLREGDQTMSDSFALASQVAANNPQVFYKQATVYASEDNNLRCLTSACQALQRAVELNPAFFEAWYLWGKVLVNIGTIQSETLYFQEADQKFKQAHAYAADAIPMQLGLLNWQWGRSCYAVGQLSGEAHDFNQALMRYRMAMHYEVEHPDFFNDFGNSLASLGVLLGRKEFFLEAAALFQKVAEHPGHPHGYLNLACNYQRLFELEHEDVYFDLANEAFTRTSEGDFKSFDLWLCWGRLFADWGKINEDLEYLQMSCQKFAQANEIEPNHPLVLSLWSEARMLCGAYNERLDLLRDAEAKSVRSLELNSESADAWRIYGTCLTELARYFSDEPLYEKAIEKYRYGLSLNPQHGFLWYGLALAHFALGDLRNDAKLVEQAVKHCAKAVACGGKHVTLQFWNDWGVALMKLAEMNNDQDSLELAIEKFVHAIGTENPEDDSEPSDIDWLYNYGCALDFLGDFTNDANDYEKAAQVLNIVVQQDPAYTQARYNLALALTHLGDLTEDVDCLYKALEHYLLVLQEEMEDQSAWNDCGMTLLSVAQMVHDPIRPDISQQYYQQAEDRFTQAVALGCHGAYYHLACLYSLQGNYTAAMHYLERSKEVEALPPVDELLHDEWLEGLRNTAAFRNFITLLSHKHEPAQEEG